MIVTVEIHRDRYGLVIEEIGPHFAKVFCEVKAISGKTTKEVSTLLKSTRPIVLIASKRELIMLSSTLTKVGAKIAFELMDYAANCIGQDAFIYEGVHSPNL